LEGPIQRTSEPREPPPFGKSVGRPLPLVGRCKPGDRPLDPSQFQPTDPHRFSGSVRSRNGGTLVAVHGNESGAHPAPQQLGQLRVRYEVEAAGEKVADLGPLVPTLAKDDSLDPPVTLGPNGPASGPVRNSAQLAAQVECLPETVSLAHKTRREPPDPPSGGLFRNEPDLGPLRSQVRCGGEEKGTRPSDHDRTALHR